MHTHTHTRHDALGTGSGRDSTVVRRYMYRIRTGRGMILLSSSCLFASITGRKARGFTAAFETALNKPKRPKIEINERTRQNHSLGGGESGSIGCPMTFWRRTVGSMAVELSAFRASCRAFAVPAVPAVPVCACQCPGARPEPPVALPARSLSLHPATQVTHS